MAKKLTTNTKADPRRDVGLVVGDRLFKLKVPYSIPTWGTFTIGDVRFKMLGNGSQCQAIDPIPASWLVDISGDVIETHDDEELEGFDLA